MYEFSLNVSTGGVDATDVYDKFRSDVATVQVQVRPFVSRFPTLVAFFRSCAGFTTSTTPPYLHTHPALFMPGTSIGSEPHTSRPGYQSYVRKKRGSCAGHSGYQCLKSMPADEMYRMRQTIDNASPTLPPTWGRAESSRLSPTMPLTWLYGRRKTLTSTTRPQRWCSMVE